MRLFGDFTGDGSGLGIGPGTGVRVMMSNEGSRHELPGSVEFVTMVDASGAVITATQRGGGMVEWWRGGRWAWWPWLRVGTVY